MHRSTLRRCWKCKANVSHYIARGHAFWWRPLYRQTPVSKPLLVPVRHLVEKNGHFIVCPGTGRTA